MRIFFVGMPGSGKSTVAKELALSIDCDFVDVDEYIELKYQKTISEIFKAYGEVKFRQFENLALTELLDKDNTVVATGGGTPCFNNNMQLMNDAGKTIYLKASENTLFNRVTKGENVRPLIQSKSEEDVKLYLNKTLIEREQFYNQADLIIDVNKDISEILNLINSLIKHS